MKRKMAVLTVLGALVALAVPAASSATMAPAGHQWEIAGGATPPKVGTSLGTCAVTKITGTIPAAPKNETENNFPTAMTLGSCSSGTTATVAGQTNIVTNGYRVYFGIQTLTLKFSSLPGCKLSGTALLSGLWLDGVLSKKSAYYAENGGSLTWSDDGASCALTGKKEAIIWSTGTGAYNTVNNLTSSSFPVWVA